MLASLVLTSISCAEQRNLSVEFPAEELAGARFAIIAIEGTTAPEAHVVRGDFEAHRLRFDILDDAQIYLAIYAESSSELDLEDGPLVDYPEGEPLPAPDRISVRSIRSGELSGAWEPTRELGPRLRTLRVPPITRCRNIAASFVRTKVRDVHAIRRETDHSVRIAVGQDQRLRILEIRDDGELRDFGEVTAPLVPKTAAFTPEGRLIAAGHVDGEPSAGRFWIGDDTGLVETASSGEDSRVITIVPVGGDAFVAAFESGHVRAFDGSSFGPAIEAPVAAAGPGGSPLAARSLEDALGISAASSVVRISAGQVTTLELRSSVTQELSHASYSSKLGWLLGAYDGSVYSLDGASAKFLVRSEIGVSRVTSILPVGDGLLISGFWSWIHQAYPNAQRTFTECPDPLRITQSAHLHEAATLTETSFAIIGVPIHGVTDDDSAFIAFVSVERR